MCSSKGWRHSNVWTNLGPVAPPVAGGRQLNENISRKERESQLHCYPIPCKSFSDWWEKRWCSHKRGALEPPAASFRALQQDSECKLLPNIEEMFSLCFFLPWPSFSFRGTEIRSFENLWFCCSATYCFTECTAIGTIGFQGAVEPSINWI